ncbi:hypothetical protein J3D64_000456 [Priestia megaterium]|nr:hypothetical protein [Priestia megaterium]
MKHSFYLAFFLVIATRSFVYHFNGKAALMNVSIQIAHF